MGTEAKVNTLKYSDGVDREKFCYLGVIYFRKFWISNSSEVEEREEICFFSPHLDTQRQPTRKEISFRKVWRQEIYDRYVYPWVCVQVCTHI